MLGLVAVALAGDQRGQHVRPAQLPGRPDRRRSCTTSCAQRDTTSSSSPVRQTGDTLALPSDYLVGVVDSGTLDGHDVYDSPLLAQRPADAAHDLEAGPARHAGEPFTRRLGRRRAPLADADHAAGRRPVCVAVGQHLTDVDHAVDRPGLDRRAGRRRGAGPAGLRSARRSSGPACSRWWRSSRPRRRSPAATSPGGCPIRSRAGRTTTELGRLSRALNAMLTQIETAFTARAASETAARAAEAAARDAAVAAQVSEARARRSEERMRQFVADASHELRTPLTTIRGFAELLPAGRGRLARGDRRAAAPDRGRGGPDGPARRGPAAAGPAGPGAAAARWRRWSCRCSPCDAVQAARAVAPDRHDRAGDRRRAPGALVVLGDDARLRQVIGNLMTNALTHTPAGRVGDAAAARRAGQPTR